MSFSTSLRSFSRKAASARLAAFGIDAEWNGEKIRAIVHSENDLEQMTGGYEVGEKTLRMEIADPRPRVHDRIVTQGRTWIIDAIRESEFTPSRILTVSSKP
jgi:hypothetical protein